MFAIASAVIARIFSLVRRLKTMISSIRLINSGRNACRRVSSTFSVCSAGVSDWSIRYSAPRFEVIMIIVFLKSTVRPLLSVRRPSSNIWSKILKTSGWAFSISSNKMTWYGRRRTLSVKIPPSSYPTYPGGEPIRRDTECFSIYSDISTLNIAFSSLNKNSAKLLLSSVLPTPVGPKNRNEPIGWFGLEMPERERRTAFATASTASSCPIMRFFRWSSRCSSFSRSEESILSVGMPVHLETTLAISSGWTVCSQAFLVFFSSSESSAVSLGIIPYCSSPARS